MKEQGIETKGWFFLTGPPARIDRVLTDFQLRRQRDPDGSVEHISGVFILGRDGREVREYDGEIVKATTVISDLQQVLESRKARPAEARAGRESLRGREAERERRGGGQRRKHRASTTRSQHSRCS